MSGDGSVPGGRIEVTGAVTERERLPVVVVRIGAEMVGQTLPEVSDLIARLTHAMAHAALEAARDRFNEQLFHRESREVVEEILRLLRRDLR